MINEFAVPQAIRANAELVIAMANKRGHEVGYDEEGVRWLDGFIQRQHEQGDRGHFDGLISTLGSYLGECMVHAIGGESAQIFNDGSAPTDAEAFNSTATATTK